MLTRLLKRLASYPNSNFTANQNKLGPGATLFRLKPDDARFLTSEGRPGQLFGSLGSAGSRWSGINPDDEGAHCGLGSNS
jgi:hypothetical protein